MKAEIEMERQHLKRLENQRDIEAIEAKIKVYAAEESKRKGARLRFKVDVLLMGNVKKRESLTTKQLWCRH